MFKKLVTTIAIAGALLLTSTSTAQSRITVKRNGQTVIVVTPRHVPSQPCRVTPRRVVVTPRRCVRPPFRYMRHIRRFYHRANHARHRCTYCIRYDRWRAWKPCRYDPIIRVCR